MQLESYFQTLLLMNIKGDTWDFYKIILMLSCIMFMKYYTKFYDYLTDFYYKNIENFYYIKNFYNLDCFFKNKLNIGF